MIRIRLIPLQFSRLEVLEDLLVLLRDTLHVEPMIRPQRLDLDKYFDPVRSQYNANEIIQDLVKQAQAGEKVVGLTDLDLFIPVLSYIFGQAYLGGSAALISGHRLDNIRYGLAADEGLYAQRLGKNVLHELGHAFGLRHCLHTGCLMVSSTYVEELDQKDMKFCPQCSSLLHSAMRGSDQVGTSS